MNYIISDEQLNLMEEADYIEVGRRGDKWNGTPLDIPEDVVLIHVGAENMDDSFVLKTECSAKLREIASCFEEGDAERIARGLAATAYLMTVAEALSIDRALKAAKLAEDIA